MQHALKALGGFLMFEIAARQAGALGLLGLALAVIGVYGVVSYGAGVTIALIAIALAACFIPARRAARMAAIDALREE